MHKLEGLIIVYFLSLCVFGYVCLSMIVNARSWPSPDVLLSCVVWCGLCVFGRAGLLVLPRLQTVTWSLRRSLKITASRIRCGKNLARSAVQTPFLHPTPRPCPLSNRFSHALFVCRRQFFLTLLWCVQFSQLHDDWTIGRLDLCFRLFFFLSFRLFVRLFFSSFSPFVFVVSVYLSPPPPPTNANIPTEVALHHP